jgi:RNA polymerase sigma factor (sigma-70 family)
MTQKPEDNRTDEALIEAHYAGDETALTILCQRYLEPLWNHARYMSWSKDKSFIDDIQQQTMVTILEDIENEKFKPTGQAGSFRAWAYDICRRVTLAANQRRRIEAIPLSERYPEEFPQDLVDTNPTITDYHEENQLLDRVLSWLSEEERQLFILLSQKVPYNKIIAIPPFDKYKDKPELLRQKACRLRKYIVALMKEKE